MGDSSHSSSSRNLAMSSNRTSRKASGALIASIPQSFKQKTVKNLGLLYHGTIGLRHDRVGHVAVFLLQVATLEVMRRMSRAYCPLAWRGLQALQTICYPPFKWLHKWLPFKWLLIGMQKLSGPLLFLSVATALSDQLEDFKEVTASDDDSQSCKEPDLDSTETIPILDTGMPCEPSQSSSSDCWLLQLNEELKHENITLPERIDEDELRRFFAASNGDFSCLLSSVKKTILWRETYNFLSAEELEVWSHLVFWHGYDRKLRPCLFIRLGLACNILPSKDKYWFVKAIVSQIERGVLHLVNVEDPRITVVMDCEGLTPLKFPMHMLKSCSALVQDNYPNRLSYLFIVQLPPIVRVLTQTFIQVLKPVTRKKLRIEGSLFYKVLSEYLLTMPLFLGGNCSCSKCSVNHVQDADYRWPKLLNLELKRDTRNDKDRTLASHICQLNPQIEGNWEEVQRAGIIALLMVCVFVMFCFEMHKPGSLSLLWYKVTDSTALSELHGK